MQPTNLRPAAIHSSEQMELRKRKLVDAGETVDTMAKRILRRRKEMGLTQREVGRKVGVTRQTVSAWEHGVAQDIQGKHLEQLGRALKVSTKWLLHGGELDPCDGNEQHANDQQKTILVHVMRMTDDELRRTLEFIQRMEQEQRELYEQLKARFERKTH